MGPARVSTIIMIVLILIGMIYPIYFIYKRLASCLNKPRQTNMEVTRSEKEDSTKNQKRFRKVNSRRDPEGEALDDDRRCHREPGGSL